LIACVAGTLPSLAQADVLFVDFNGSGTEIAAAERAAKARGEKLWVIPEIPKAERDQIAKVDARVHRAKRYVEKVQKDVLRVSGRSEKEQAQAMKAYVQAIDRFYDLQGELRPLTDPYSFKAKDIEARMKQLAAEGHQIKSIVLSGHSAGEDFEGNMGKLSLLEAKVIFPSDHPVHQSLEGVYLWGCYTGTRAATLGWKGVFPQSDLIMGFYKQAPTDQTKASPEILEDALKREPEMSRIKEVEAAKAALAALEHAGSFPLAALINECHVGTRIQSTVTKEEDLKCAVDSLGVREDYQKIFLPAQRGGNGDETQYLTEWKQSLRKFYNRFQNTRHCPTVKEITLDPRQVISLIHSQEVVENASLAYRDQWIALKQQVARFPGMGLETAELVQKLIDAKATRLDISRLHDRLFEITAWSEVGEHADLIREIRDSLKGEHLEATRVVLTTLNDLKCIPMSWYERPVPGVLPEKAGCQY